MFQSSTGLLVVQGKRLLDGAKPSLHSWNNFGVNVNKRKTPTTRPSPIKKCRVAPEVSAERRESDALKEEIQKLKGENSLLKGEKEKIQENIQETKQSHENLVNDLQGKINSLHKQIEHMPSIKS